MCSSKELQKTNSSGALLSAALVIVLALSPVMGNASGPLVEGVSILERGIYSVVSTGLTATVGTLGPVQHVRSVKLIVSTTHIPGRKMVRFGVRYVVHGMPLGAGTEIRLITRFPDRGLAGATDDRTRHLQSEYKVRNVFGSVAYREFLFDDEREIIPGEWVFEFWFGTRKVGEQKFCVYDIAAAEHPAGRDGCSALVASLVELP